MPYGMKVSRVGNDVNTADPNELLLSTDYPTLKIAEQGTGTVVDGDWTKFIGEALYIKEVTHSLGYVPIVFFYYFNPKSNCEKWFLGPCSAPGFTYTSAPSQGYELQAYADRKTADPNNVTQLNFQFSDIYEAFPSPLPDIDYKYFICVDPAR